MGGEGKEDEEDQHHHHLLLPSQQHHQLHGVQQDVAQKRAIQSRQIRNLNFPRQTNQECFVYPH